MRKTNIFIALLLLSISEIAYAQTVIDFSTISFNPNFFDNGGCKTYNRFGPNPISVNGHNVRTVGSSLWTWSQPKSLTLYAFSNMETNPRENVVISVEYAFQANKTYKIEINGLNDHSWNNWIVPENHYNGVFWVKLENNPEISTTVSNPCSGSYTSVEKKIDRYSKLIADPRVAFENKNYIVKFSPLENKNALKITFDSSPNDPNLVIDNIFRLKNIKITEMPYEEDQPSTHFYYNTSGETLGQNTRNNPAYYIPYIRPIGSRPSRGDTYKALSINPNQWTSNSNGNGYSIYFSSLIDNFQLAELTSLNLLGDLATGGTRPTRSGERQNIPLPGTYQNNNYQYSIINYDVIITCTNSTNAPPSSVVDFVTTYR
ncbi:hypothetical protein [Pedobacter endophyticus]|uniref:Uncharacterized protein n=1 Tax=Pedobacter endophyticus TaxID=2789740 RepID=A0A7S9Q0Y1_9SPHI|nr:hypothetical protein [Pedobacter endophyticus]QPH41197.1 hypothetical protein IZT61_08055 [Pedobacter endophyticus]